MISVRIRENMNTKVKDWSGNYSFSLYYQFSLLYRVDGSNVMNNIMS